MRVNRKFTLNKELGSTGSMTVELELEVKYERWYSSNTLMLSGGAFFFTFSCVCYSVTSSSWMSFKRILDREGIRSEGKSCTYIDIQRSRKLGSHINAQITILAPAPLDPCHARQQIIHSLILYTLSLSHMCSKSWVYNSICMYVHSVHNKMPISWFALTKLYYRYSTYNTQTMCNNTHYWIFLIPAELQYKGIKVTVVCVICLAPSLPHSLA